MIHVIPSGPLETNAIILYCPSTKRAAIIDPAMGSAPHLQAFVEQHSLQVEKILLTHTHWDHTADAAAVKRLYNAPVYVHAADRPNLEKPGSDGLPMMTPIEPVQADSELYDGQDLRVGELHLKVFHTPGHSPGGVCFYDQEHHLLISGDTLFKGSIGVLHFPGASPDAMWRSLDRLAALPAETRVYPGHGPATTIGKESWLPRAKEIFGSTI